MSFASEERCGFLTKVGSLLRLRHLVGCPGSAFSHSSCPSELEIKPREESVGDFLVVLHPVCAWRLRCARTYSNEEAFSSTTLYKKMAQSYIKFKKIIQ